MANDRPYMSGFSYVTCRVSPAKNRKALDFIHPGCYPVRLCSMFGDDRGQVSDLRRKILAAALEILANEGYQQLSIRKLGERIGYSPTTIYLHFIDKADLFECVCEETF